VQPVKISVVRLVKLVIFKVPDSSDPLRSTVVIPVLVKLNLLKLVALITQFSSVIPDKLVQPEKFMLLVTVCRAEKTAVPSSPVHPLK
jgi:hypothetical protein